MGKSQRKDSDSTMQTKIRYWEYYDMKTTFTELYDESLKGKKFNNLYELITCRENILLAYRNIKANQGSYTEGVDKRTIKDIKNFNENKIVDEVRRILSNYQPKKVKRVFIPKANGTKRPLGIPSIMDRIIQQCFKQILEPIAEAKFYKHSYGFRPLRTTHNAMARLQFLINNSKLHYVVDIDIKGFFDNINHTLLIKQLWNIGIIDKRVLKIISKMLKAEIDGEGIPTKGTPQGGILSPLLSNIVLNDLDHWIADQWESFETDYTYNRISDKFDSLRNYSNLKEGYIVRYADDFKLICRNYELAQRWFHAIRLYLKDRLKLDISKEKSKIINLRKKKSEFLGFTIWAEKKGNKYVAQTGISEKRIEQIKTEYKSKINIVKKSPTMKNIMLLNSYILGIHNYFKKATQVNHQFAQIAYQTQKFTYNRLKNVGKYEKPINPSTTYKKLYGTNYRTFRIADTHIFPIGNIKHTKNFQFTQKLIPYTEEGRELIYKKMNNEVAIEVRKLMLSNIPDKSVEYFDNRISRYSMKNGKCEILKIFLPAEFVHCHHYLPIKLGGTDQFRNLRIIHKEVHKLVHATNNETINKLKNLLNLTDEQIKKINQYRKECNLELIN